MSIIIVLTILFAVICYLAASGMILLRRTQNDAPALISPNYRPFYLGLAWLAAGLHSIVLAQIIPASDGIDLSIFSTAANKNNNTIIKLTKADATQIFRSALADYYEKIMNDQDAKEKAMIDALLDVQ